MTEKKTKQPDRRTPLERMTELTRRLVAVRKDELPKATRKKTKHR